MTARKIAPRTSITAASFKVGTPGVGVLISYVAPGCASAVLKALTIPQAKRFIDDLRVCIKESERVSDNNRPSTS